jgi:hypothetical protein
MRYHQKAKPRFSGNVSRIIRELARELGGDIAGPSWILAPAPGMPPADRSLQVALSHSAPDGFMIVSRSASRDEARAYVAAAIDRLRSSKAAMPDLFDGSAT